MEVDTKALMEKALGELSQAQAQLQQLEAQRNQLLQFIFQKQGEIGLLQRLNGQHKEKEAA